MQHDKGDDERKEQAEAAVSAFYFLLRGRVMVMMMMEGHELFKADKARHVRCLLGRANETLPGQPNTNGFCDKRRPKDSRGPRVRAPAAASCRFSCQVVGVVIESTVGLPKPQDGGLVRIKHARICGRIIASAGAQAHPGEGKADWEAKEAWRTESKKGRDSLRSFERTLDRIWIIRILTSGSENFIAYPPSLFISLCACREVLERKKMPTEVEDVCVIPGCR